MNSYFVLLEGEAETIWVLILEELLARSFSTKMPHSQEDWICIVLIDVLNLVHALTHKGKFNGN